MKHNLPILLFLLGVLCSGQLRAQYLVSFQNNTALDYDFQVVQTGNISLSNSQYTVIDTLLTAYANGMDMLQFEPDTTMAPGDSVDFAGMLTNSSDTIIIQMRVVMDSMGPTVSYSGAGSGFDLSWFTDVNFHSAAFTMQGDPFTLKFKRIADLVDMDDDVLFAVQEDFIYSLDSLDFSDPGVINVMAYNLQMTPVVSFNFLERGTYFPPLISPYQDVVVIEELFDDPTRINVLTPGMVAAGFPYATTILNDTALSHITSPSNGGVIIYSRWP
ncbi:MAG: hypothetical protein JKY52_06685, partial [Flavobacteriales bacterium]|nr:hypothetical protein [Flavobacteriales bacterium]